MSTRLRWLLFAGLCFMQWSLPLAMVQRAEQTLQQGATYRFRTAPVDPVDPFRGRYVTLDFEAAQIEVPPAWRFETGARLYAPIAVDVDGFARLGVPQAAPPTRGDWLIVRLQWRDDERHQVRVDLPFDRYYLDEQLAPEAERLYWVRNRAEPGDAEADPRRPTWASVRVLRDTALLDELYIDDVPVRERVKAVLAEDGAP